MAVCRQGAHRVDSGRHLVHRGLCRACGQCVAVCASGALAIKGHIIGAADVVGRAVRLKPFFRHSNGGITLTGGEVTAQYRFAVAILEGCQAEGIHTAIETSGACSWPALARLVAHTDLVLYDLKLMDEAAHRRWVGASNRLILENAARLAGHNVQVRVPLVPGLTDTEENLRQTFEFMGRVELRSAALLPYNAAAGAKYEWLDLPYEVQGAPQSREHLERLLDMARGFGLEAAIG